LEVFDDGLKALRALEASRLALQAAAYHAARESDASLN